MNKVVLMLACLTIALLGPIDGVFAQANADVLGTWTGHTFVEDGNRRDLVMTVAEGEEGLTAKIGDAAGTMPEFVCRDVVFENGRLTAVIDYPTETDLIRVRISLELEGDSLKGFWSEPGGASDVIELVRKK